jgi:hypothetical protein
MGAITAAAALHIVTADQASTISTSVTQIGNGIQLIAAGMAPLIALATGLYSAWTATHTQQIASVNSIPGVKVVSEASPEPAVSTVPKNGGIVMGFPPPPSAEH